MLSCSLTHLLLLATATITATAAPAAASSAAPKIPSGDGIIQVQNGNTVLGCINSDAMYVLESTANSQCNVYTANETTGIIRWQNDFQVVYLGIPVDAFPQTLALYSKESEGIKWEFAPDSEVSGLLWQADQDLDFQVWAAEVVPAAGSAQALFAGQGAPSAPAGGYFVWVSK